MNTSLVTQEMIYVGMNRWLWHDTCGDMIDLHAMLSDVFIAMLSVSGLHLEPFPTETELYERQLQDLPSLLALHSVPDDSQATKSDARGRRLHP